jgi:restriction system protein
VAAKGQAEFVKWMGPVLDCLREMGGEAKPREVSDRIADKLSLPTQIRGALLKSGAERFHNQVQWARQYLVWEGVLDSSKRGVWTLTPKGTQTHLTPEGARALFNKWVDIHAKARKQRLASSEVQTTANSDLIPPDVQDEEELLQVLQKLSPNGFERVCQRLLRATGFEKVTVTGQSHDGGIDGVGILQVNPFVSFKVLFQCKRYKGAVSRAQVGDFRNAMFGRADKGIIITTGTFSPDARKEAEREGTLPVELVDGEKLVSMFEVQQVGVRPKTIYEVDLEFFEQFRE